MKALRRISGGRLILTPPILLLIILLAAALAACGGEAETVEPEIVEVTREVPVEVEVVREVEVESPASEDVAALRREMESLRATLQASDAETGDSEETDAATPEPAAPAATPRPTATPRPSPTATPVSMPRLYRVTPCRANSQGKVEWEQRPTIINGYLVMSGRTSDGARIHDARSPSDSRGNKYPAFTLNNLYKVNGVRRLQSVGKIWPEDMASRLSGIGTANVLAESYDVSSSKFNVRAQIPASLLEDDIQLLVAVWGANPGSGARAIGAECASYN